MDDTHTSQYGTIISTSTPKEYMVDSIFTINRYPPKVDCYLKLYALI